MQTDAENAGDKQKIRQTFTVKKIKRKSGIQIASNDSIAAMKSKKKMEPPKVQIKVISFLMSQIYAYPNHVSMMNVK